MSFSEGEDDACSSSLNDMSLIRNPLVVGSDMTIEMCRVCGKNAAGKHYSVPACHGCKSFFRRAILNKTIYPDCKYDSQCFLRASHNVRPRKCRYCRLQKCYKVGMVAVVAVNRKNDSPRNSDTELPDLPGMASPMVAVATPIATPIATRETFVSGIIDKLHNLDIQTDKFRKSAYNPLFIPTLEGILSSAGKLDLADKYGAMTGWPITQESFNEQQVIMNQIKADGLVTDNLSSLPVALPASTAGLGINTKEWLSFDMLTAIEYAKTFPFFQGLESNDKILLAKATTFMNLALTSSYSSFISKMAVLQMPDGVCISGPADVNAKSAPLNDVSAFASWPLLSETSLTKLNMFC